MRLQVSALRSLRNTEDNIPPPLNANGFVHSADFLDYEQYKTIGREALMNIGLGFAMIAVIVIFLIANPLASFLTFVSVASAILELVGFMYFRGTRIDSVTVIFLVISLGLAVDYSVHVAHGYLANRAQDPVVRLQGTMKVCPLPALCTPTSAQCTSAVRGVSFKSVTCKATGAPGWLGTVG